MSILDKFRVLTGGKKDEPNEGARKEAQDRVQTVAHRSELLVQSTKFEKFLALARKDLGGDGEIGLFFFMQSMVFLHNKTGDHKKTVDMMQGWLDGVKGQIK